MISLSRFYLRSQRGRPVVHWLLMRLPALGMIYHIALLGRCRRTMGTLGESGASMLDSVAISHGVVADHYFEQPWDRVNDRLHRGDQLGAPLWWDPLMPRPVVQMIHSSECSGQLGQMLTRVAEFLEDELRARVQAGCPASPKVSVWLSGGVEMAVDGTDRLGYIDCL